MLNKIFKSKIFMLLIAIVTALVISNVDMQSSYAADNGLEGEAYAVFDSTDGSLTFFRDEEGKYTHNQVVGTKTYYTVIETINEDGDFNAPWYSNFSSVQSVAFEDVIKPQSTAYWFKNMRITSITGLDKLDTSNVTDMRYMFYGCSNLTSLDVSHFDTSNVTHMGSMFRGCESLTYLDVTHFDTSNVEDMTFMFNSCQSLTSLDLSHFDTSRVTDMWSMFEHCSSLTSLDVSHFDTSNAIDMSRMFEGCLKLTSLDISHFDTSKVTDMSRMFLDCIRLTTTLNVMNMPSPDYKFQFMFEGAATASGSQIIVKYISPVTSTNINTLVRTNRVGGNVVNGGEGDKSHIKAMKIANALYHLKNRQIRYLDSIDTSVYSGPEKIAVENLINEAKDDIQNATTSDDVQAIMDKFNEDLANIKTDEQKADALNEAKQTAINNLNDINTSVYSEPEKSIVEQKINTAKENIKNADSIESIDTIVNTFNTELSEIPTAEQKEQQDLNEYKTNMSLVVDNIVNINDYPEAFRNNIEHLINKAKEDIANATSKDEIDNIIAKLTEDLAKIETTVQKEAREAKEQAMAELDKVDTSKYSGDEKAAVENLINQSKNDIQNATSVDGVQAVMNKFNENLAKIKTGEQKQQEQKQAQEAERKKQAANDLQKKIDNAKKIDSSKLDGKSKADLEQAIKDAEAALNENKDAKTLEDALKNLTTIINNITYITPINPVISTKVTPSTPADVQTVEKAIANLKNDGDIKGSTFRGLKLRSKKQTKKSIKLNWNKTKGAKKYIVYGNLCGNNKKLKKITTTTKRTINVKKVAGKKLKKNKFYKFVVYSVNANGKVTSISKTIHVTTLGKKKVANPKSVTVKKAIIKKASKLKKGKTLKLKAKSSWKKGKKCKQHVKVRYESLNKKIATVSKAGKIKSKKKGTTKILCYTQNGIYKTIKVRVV